jgi:hypothetical protein
MNAGKTRSFLDLFRFTKELTVQSFVIAYARIRNVDGATVRSASSAMK